MESASRVGVLEQFICTGTAIIGEVVKLIWSSELVKRAARDIVEVRFAEKELQGVTVN